MLEAHGMTAAIGGAIAYGFWGTTRGTKDADINVFVDEARYAELQRVLEAGGLGPAPGRAPWTPEERAAFDSRRQLGRGARAWRAAHGRGGSSSFAAKW